MSIELLKAAIREIQDFPKKGILFRDITPLLKSPILMNEILDIMADNYKDQNPTIIVGLESRGFIFGMALATKMGVPFAPIRKKGKLPYKTYSVTYDLEYGSDTIEIHQDAINSKDRIIVVDDLLATGGTAIAAEKLIKHFNAKVLGFEFVIELESLKGREKLKGYNVNAIAVYP
ncbi:MAG TPA: adenine phosphoribosyltransferase [Lentisphaeria bacterium]|nr:MAG: adenine phosphoribosyltransferase [Lentisphaerae bacterium GWF2_38_69]HBM15229.1 adenine phosphoribosyltransferase [Lentisphaeria bacterium]